MSYVVLDECLYYLKEADNYLSLYQELDPFEEIFEAYKPETQLKVEQNQKAKTGVKGSLIKACEAIKRMIQNLIDSIRDFFDKRKLDEETRKAYDAFKEKCAKNPELKNKKITVRDYLKINEDYKKILSEAEQADKELAKGKEINLDNLFSKINKFCGDTAKGVTVAVGMEAALNIASSSQGIAKSIYNSLKADKAFEQKLMDAVGKTETKLFEAQMKSLGKRISLHRSIMKMKGTYSRSVEEGINKTFDSVWDALGSIKNLVGTTKGNDPDLAVKGNVLQRAKGTASYLSKNFGTLAKDGSNALVKGGSIGRRLLGNKTIRDTAMDTLHTNSQMTKDARKQYRQKQKEEKRKLRDTKKKKPIHSQSPMDALLGKNDPDSLTNRFVNSRKK